MSIEVLTILDELDSFGGIQRYFHLYLKNSKLNHHILSFDRDLEDNVNILLQNYISNPKAIFTLIKLVVRLRQYVAKYNISNILLGNGSLPFIIIGTMLPSDNRIAIIHGQDLLTQSKLSITITSVLIRKYRVIVNSKYTLSKILNQNIKRYKSALVQYPPCE
jgi:hypothetical protein